MSKEQGYKWIDYTCSGGAGYICQFDCNRDPFWCVHGSVKHKKGTCSCKCKAPWSGDHCDVLRRPVSPLYEINRELMTFSDAQSHCHQLRGQLPSVSDEKDFKTFRNYLKKRKSLKDKSFFIDLQLVNDSWVDSDGRTPSKLQWSVGQPRSGSCAILRTVRTYKWETIDCEEQARFACEFPCRKAKEDWCIHGDIVISKGKCKCQCWPGSFGDYCEEYDYNNVLNKTILFYETQRSGRLPADNRIPWRSDSALDDQGIRGEDLSGGWYDAGDFIKVTFKHTQNVWKLAWGFLEFGDAYIEAGQLDYFYRCLKWGADYILTLHTAPNEFYAHIADPKVDHRYWGRPEEMTMYRPAEQINITHPGTEVACNGAAALASSYMVFRDKDFPYAEELLMHAKQLYDFGNTYRGVWSESIPWLEFKSGTYYDELANGALWLYIATKEQKYLDDAISHYNEFGLRKVDPLFSRNRISLPLQLMMAITTGEAKYLKPFEEGMERWFPGSAYYTPKGLAVVSDNRPFKRVVDVAFAALVAAKHDLHTEEYLNWARGQIHYILGDTGRSFLSGFGKHPPTRVHHRAASCPDLPLPCGKEAQISADPNPQPLMGALVGGPDRRDNYFDHRRNYEQNEAGINVAGFQSAVAGLADFRNKKT
ncbi:uncharacterized protein LOC144439923 [Glandiceps talaboti]